MTLAVDVQASRLDVLAEAPGADAEDLRGPVGGGQPAGPRVDVTGQHGADLVQGVAGADRGVYGRNEAPLHPRPDDLHVDPGVFRCCVLGEEADALGWLERGH